MRDGLVMRIIRSDGNISNNLIRGFIKNIFLCAMLIIISVGIYLRFDFPFGYKFFPHLSSFIFVLLFLTELLIFIKLVVKPIRQIERTIDLITGEDISFLIGYTPKDIHNLDEQLIESISKCLKKVLNVGSTAEIIKKQTQFAALQSQINPHFLYNTLDSIRGKAVISGVDEIADMIEALSNFFRYSISTKGDLVTLEDELKNVRNYFMIQQYRFKNRFELFIEYDEEDNLLEYVLPKLTIQPIIENSILHGFEDKIGIGTIKLRITATEKRLIIEISDNGIGMDKAMASRLNDKLRRNLSQTTSSDTKRHGGIALVNVNQRIRLFFGADYGITVSSIQNVGTDVEVVIPLMHENDIEKLENFNETRSFKDGTYL